MATMASMDDVVGPALSAERDLLLEHEVLDLLDALELTTPRRRFVPRAAVHRAESWRDLPFEEGVLKVVSAELIHKTDRGALRFIETTCADTVMRQGEKMIAGLPRELDRHLQGLLLTERVRVEPLLGRELLVSLRHAPAFGPALTVGFGGTAVEHLNRALQPLENLVIRVPGATTAERLDQKLDRSLWFRAATGGLRGVPAACAADELRRELNRWLAALERAAEWVRQTGRLLVEIEINPLAWAGRWLPLDGMARLGSLPSPGPPPCPQKLRRALQPSSVALVGASRADELSVGRIILDNLLAGGMSPHRIAVVHPTAERIAEVECLPDLTALETPVDLLILALAAPLVPSILEMAIADGRIGALLLVAGGMGETEQGRPIEQQIRRLLDTAPAARRPVLIGNNSLGLTSRRAHLDCLFIPRHKRPRSGHRTPGLALCSQSGAFLLAQLSRLDSVCPDYLLSIGNQIDAGAPDFVDALAADPSVGTLGLYLEGLRAGDGERLCATAQSLAGAGRDLIVYLAGRSEAGQRAARSHTAALAGDWCVASEALDDAGALVAKDLEDFAALVELSCALRARRFSGRRAALMSNAGYELVGMADGCGGAPDQLATASLTEGTRRQLESILEEAGLAQLVRADNPLDVTPMANDEVHERCAELLLADPNVDVALIGAVPFTARMHTLPGNRRSNERCDAPGSYAQRVAALCRRQPKPMCVVVDAGPQYEALRQTLRMEGVAVQARGDEAVRRLGRYVTHRLRWR